MRLVNMLLLPFLLPLACGDNDRPAGEDVDAAPIDTGTAVDADDDATPVDTGMGPDAAVGVLCGPTVCASGQECCVQGAARSCVAAGACTGVSFTCDGAEDCTTAGEVCCVGGGGPGSDCEPANSCQTPTCVTANDCPHANQECCTVGPMMICANQCPGP